MRIMTRHSLRICVGFALEDMPLTIKPAPDHEDMPLTIKPAPEHEDMPLTIKPAPHLWSDFRIRLPQGEHPLEDTGG